MFSRINSQRASLALEYALLIAIVVSALLSMMVYTKRAIMGKWRQNIDSLSNRMQYEPGVTKVTVEEQ